MVGAMHVMYTQQILPHTQPLQVTDVASLAADCKQEPSNNSTSSSEADPGEGTSTNNPIEPANNAIAFEENANSIELTEPTALKRTNSIENIPSTIDKMRRQSSDALPLKKRHLTDDEDDDDAVNVMPRKIAKRRHTVFPRSQRNLENAPKKNDNPLVHISSSLYNKLCVLCGVSTRSLVKHYTLEHREVFVSRPSPTFSQRLRQANIPFVRANGKFRGECCFCEQEKAFNRSNWQRHLLTHTGELLFHCVECNTSVDVKRDHIACDSNGMKNIFDIEASDSSLVGFMCAICNYLRFKKADIMEHLSTEHGAIDAHASCERAVLVNISAANWCVSEYDRIIVRHHLLYEHSAKHVDSVNSRANHDNHLPNSAKLPISLLYHIQPHSWHTIV